MSAKLRIATFLAPTMLPIYEFVVDAIGRELGSGAELVVGTSFDQFGNGKADAGFITLASLDAGNRAYFKTRHVRRVYSTACVWPLQSK